MGDEALRRLGETVSAWLFGGAGGMDLGERARLGLARVGCALAAVGYGSFAIVHVSTGAREQAATCAAMVIALALNVLAFRWHRSVDASIYLLGGAVLVEETLTVALTANLADSLPMWGIVPVAAALLLRHRRQVAFWLALFAAACLAQVHFARPAAFALPHPYLTFCVSLLVYGALALSYCGTREWSQRRIRAAEDEARRLSALLPICSYCKRIRDDEGYWHQVEAYLMEHTGADLTHSICPTCTDDVRGQLALLDLGRGRATHPEAAARQVSGPPERE